MEVKKEVERMQWLGGFGFANRNAFPAVSADVCRELFPISVNSGDTYEASFKRNEFPFFFKTLRAKDSFFTLNGYIALGVIGDFEFKSFTDFHPYYKNEKCEKGSSEDSKHIFSEFGHNKTCKCSHDDGKESHIEFYGIPCQGEFWTPPWQVLHYWQEPKNGSCFFLF